MPKPPKLGSTKEFRCPACRRKNTHDVIWVGDGLSHQRCRGCNEAHAYAVEDLGVDVVAQDLPSLMTRLSPNDPASYRASDPFHTGQFIEHKKFGTGYVLNVRGATKMEILFGDRTRLLVCGPGSST